MTALKPAKLSLQWKILDSLPEEELCKDFHGLIPLCVQFLSSFWHALTPEQFEEAIGSGLTIDIIGYRPAVTPFSHGAEAKNTI